MNDYIRRKEVYQKLHDAGGCDASDEWSKGYDAAIDVAIEIIENMPSTADVAPVVHGHWIKVKHPYGNVNWYKKCSLCGKCIDWQNYNFCPNCGAKMDESKEENHNMTKEEAIKQLIDLKDDRQSFLGGVDDEIYLADIEAIDFAVKHLQNDCHSDSGLPDTQKRL